MQSNSAGTDLEPAQPQLVHLLAKHLLLLCFCRGKIQDIDKWCTVFLNDIKYILIVFYKSVFQPWLDQKVLQKF